MKLKKIFISFLLPILAFAQGHLLFTEVVLQPSAGEYVKIKNPTASAVDLSNYYISDATDVANGKFYYKLPDGADYWSGSGSDFIARFPARNLAAGESIILGLGRNSDYQDEYGEMPDLSLKDDMLQAKDDATTIGGSPNAKLDNIAETLILFYWDGISSTVKDVDYLLWGNNSHAIDKSGVSSYANDTPVGSQAFMPVHAGGEKLVRIDENEGTEVTSGGNGITGHDETSENLDATWEISTLAASRPVFSNIIFSPSNPSDKDTLTISAKVVDTEGLSSIECVYSFDEKETVSAMTESATDNYSCVIDPLNSTGAFTYYIRAENNLGRKDSTLMMSETIKLYVKDVDIAYFRDNFETFEETKITVTAMVTVEMGRINTYASYIQDDSNRGIYVFGSAMSGFARGSLVEVTGTLSQYNDSKQIKDITARQVGAVDFLPPFEEFSCQSLNNNFMALEGSYVTVHGQVTDRADGIGGGSNIIIDDGTMALTVRVWDSTNLLSDPTADSLLQKGNAVELKGIVGFFGTAAQLMPAYAEDVKAWTDGDPGTGNVSLTVAPYPFLPQIGETIKYSYEYPDESRVIIRLYDASGRYITTLTDEYHGVSWSMEKNWNGRDELSRMLAPGTYLMHMEVIERSTGKVTRLAQPVVIAVKK